MPKIHLTSNCNIFKKGYVTYVILWLKFAIASAKSSAYLSSRKFLKYE